MQLLAESKKGPAVHNSWQVFLLFSELLNLLSAFKAGLEGIFFSAGINCVTVGLGFFHKKRDSALLETFQLARENGKPKHLDFEKFSDFSQKNDMCLA